MAKRGKKEEPSFDPSMVQSADRKHRELDSAASENRQKEILRQLRQLTKAAASGKVFDTATAHDINTAWARVFMSLKML